MLYVSILKPLVIECHQHDILLTQTFPEFSSWNNVTISDIILHVFMDGWMHRVGCLLYQIPAITIHTNLLWWGQCVLCEPHWTRYCTFIIPPCARMLPPGLSGLHCYTGRAHHHTISFTRTITALMGVSGWECLRIFYGFQFCGEKSLL